MHAGKEYGDLAHRQFGGGGIEADRVGGEERVIGVEVEFGALSRVDRVFDGELVQSELAGHHTQVVDVGSAQIDPDHCVWLREVFGHVGEREVLVGEAPAQ